LQAFSAGLPGDGTGTAPFLLLSRTLDGVGAVKGRTRTLDGLTNMFRSLVLLSPPDVVPTALLLANSLGPPWSSGELGLGGSGLSAAVREATGASRASLGAAYRRTGDMGDAAATLRGSQRFLVQPRSLGLAEVHSALLRVAAEAGTGAAGRKQGHVTRMLRRCREGEIRYVCRAAAMNMRVGATAGTVVQAVARAVVVSRWQAGAHGDDEAGAGGEGACPILASVSGLGPDGSPGRAPSLRPLLRADAARLDASLRAAAASAKRCWASLPALERLLPALLAGGVPAMEAASRPVCGVPVSPMLAKVSTSAHDALVRLAAAPPCPDDGEPSERDVAELRAQTGGPRLAAADFKYDGQRAQIHVSRQSLSAAEDEHAGDRWAPGLVTRSEYDGSRQCHVIEAGYERGVRCRWHVRVFSRHLEHTTARWPDVCEAVASAARPWTAEVVLDAEVVAVAAAPGSPLVGGEASAGTSGVKILPFQTLSLRAKTATSGAAAAAPPPVRCAVFLFDCSRVRMAAPPGVAPPGVAEAVVAADSRGADADVCGWDITWRRAALATAVAVLPGRVERSRWAVVSDEAELSHFMREALAAGTEGLMVKVVGDHCHADAEALPTRPWDIVTRAVASRRPGGGGAAAGDDGGGNDGGDDSDVADVDDAGGSEGDDDGGEPGAPSPGRASAPSGAARQAPAAKRPRASRGGAPRAVRCPIPRARYVPGGRSDLWLKLKRDYVDSMADTLDLVPIGAWWGNGRKAGWFSPVLLAAWDPEEEQYASVCRVMSGITDEQYRALTRRYSRPGGYRLPPGAQVPPPPADGEEPAPPPPRVPRDWCPSNVSTGERPSVWFAPQEVWEVRGADLTLSPVHTAGAGLRHESRGFGLRFPRLLRQRDDKPVTAATTPDDLAQWFDRQERRPGRAHAAGGGR